MLRTWELPILHGVVDYLVPFDVNGQVVVVVTVNRRFLTGLQHVLPDTNVLILEQTRSPTAPMVSSAILFLPPHPFEVSSAR